VQPGDRAYILKAVRCADVLCQMGIGCADLGRARMTGQRLAGNLNGSILIPALLAQAGEAGKSGLSISGARRGRRERCGGTLIQRHFRSAVAGTRERV